MGDTKSFWKMGSRILVGLLIIAAQILAVFPLTDSNDLAALNALKSSWNSLPPNWVGADACGRTWDGVNRTNTRVTSLDHSNNIGLTGNLPPSIGSLINLTILFLNSNSFTGSIPPSIGNLSRLSWLDLSQNKLTGTIPVSNETASGLDKLLRARHFHLSMNQISGPIPDQLFSPNMDLIHAYRNKN
ncbi:leucine-rich repeat receptor protein kinase HPCA1-like isoform X2 [Primulina tabacum]|uniref:leucine-rich repeat receptor protein kinase HPCA1-like isoform X2 n=1 Tax=Primulina tabacum TaxID=48773 RepID=UPI003F5A2FFA